MDCSHRLAGLIVFPEQFIGPFQMPGVTKGIEQRLGQAVGAQLLAQLVQPGPIRRQGHRQRFIIGSGQFEID